MKILWISPVPSHPQDAGNRAHIFAMGRRILAAGHHVTFLFYGQETVSEEAKAAMKAFWPEFVLVPHRLKDRKKTQGEKWGLDDWFNVDLEVSINTLQSLRQFDAVYCEYVFFSKALTLFPSSVVKILSCHERMSNRLEVLKAQGLNPDFFYTTQEHEKIGLNRADLVLATQQDERKFFQSLTQKAVVEVGCPLDAEFLPARPLGEKLRIGYLGSNSALNRAFLGQFLAALQDLPELAEQVEVVVAGSVCASLEKAPVTRLGVVPSEADLYREVDLAINPRLDGGGLRINTLTALRHGVPLLATEKSSQGIPAVLDEHRCASIEVLIQHLAEIVAAPADTLPRLRDESQRLCEAYQAWQRRQMWDAFCAIGTRSTRHIRPKRVLVVTDVAFWEPGLGSHARILALCSALNRHTDLTVFFYGSIGPQRAEQIAKIGLAGRVISYKAFEEAGKKIGGKIACPRYSSLDRWRHDIFYHSLKAFLNAQPHFDAVIFEYLWLAYTRDALNYPALTILDTHDLMTYRDYRFTSQGMPVGVSIAMAQEISLLDRFDAVLAIQHEEATALAAVLRKAMPLCCPHGVELSELPEAAPDTGDTFSLGFIGGNSEANFAAINWFLQQVWPVVHRLGIALHVFGAVCQRMRVVPEGVTLHGLVEDLSVAYRQCDVMINPMIHGGGIKIKSIEALAYGKPLIASVEGAVGIEAPEESGVIVAKSRAAFIDAILLLREDPRRRAAMAVAARQAAATQFSPQHCFEPLVKLIESL